MDFENIVRQSRATKYAVHLDGVEANVLMLALEILIDSDDLTIAKDTLVDVLAHVKSVVGRKRFIELVDLKDLPEITEEAVRETVENKDFDGTTYQLDEGDGSR